MFEVGDKAFFSSFGDIDEVRIIQVSARLGRTITYEVKIKDYHLFVDNNDLFRTKQDLANHEIKQLQNKIKDLKNEIKNWEAYL